MGPGDANERSDMSSSNPEDAHYTAHSEMHELTASITDENSNTMSTASDGLVVALVNTDSNDVGDEL